MKLISAFLCGLWEASLDLSLETLSLLPFLVGTVHVLRVTLGEGMRLS